MSNFFGTNLKFLREKFGYTQTELAKKIGVNQTTIARWEDDNRVPTIDNAVDVAKVLNIELPNLLGEDLRLEKEKDYKIMTDEEQEQWSKDMLENKNAKILFDKINEHKNLTKEDAQKIADLIDIITKDYEDNHD